MRIKLFEEFSEDWDRDEFLFDLFTMTSTEVEKLFWEELESITPNLEKIEVMIESGIVDVRVKYEYDWTPLHWASWNNSIETAKLLLDAGADVEATDDDGETPLHRSCYGNFIEISKLLLDSGADPNAKDKNEWTPLHIVTYRNFIEIAEILIDRGADVEAKDNKGLTPLDWAHSDEMRALLGGGL